VNFLDAVDDDIPVELANTDRQNLLMILAISGR
jgi:hypothetical protein